MAKNLQELIISNSSGSKKSEKFTFILKEN